MNEWFEYFLAPSIARSLSTHSPIVVKSSSGSLFVCYLPPANVNIDLMECGEYVSELNEMICIGKAYHIERCTPIACIISS